MKLSFYGADQCVTGSCHCLEVGGKHILIDCGLQQGRDEIDNASLPFHPGQIDYVLVTHAHLDHSGRIPMLIKQGFQGRILTTRLTADLLDIMLQDSAHIQESDAEYKNRKNQRAGRPMEEPLYTVEDAMRVREFMDTCEYGQQIHICDGVDAVFIDAGHLLGSASIRLTLTEGGETRTIAGVGSAAASAASRPCINAVASVASTFLASLMPAPGRDSRRASIDSARWISKVRSDIGAAYER